MLIPAPTWSKVECNFFINITMRFKGVHKESKIIGKFETSLIMRVEISFCNFFVVETFILLKFVNILCLGPIGRDSI